jgi:tetratricopeptide (TPR) repeat protein
MTSSGDQRQPGRAPGRNDVREVLTLALGHHRAGRVEEAERIYRRVLAADADQPDALHLLGVAAMDRGDYRQAHELLTRAVASAPLAAEIYNAIANAERGLGRTEAAVAAYRRALALAPTDAGIATNLAAILIRGGDLPGAEAALAAAAESDPGYADAWFVRGELYRARGELAAAEASYRKALAENAVVAPSLLQLALAVRDQGRRDEAKATLRRLLALEPGHLSGRFHLAVLHQLSGEVAEAAAQYLEAEARGLASAELYTNLGLALSALERPAEAERCQRAAIARQPSAPDLYVHLAGALRDQGRWDEARDACRRAIELRADCVEAHALLGAILSRLEDDAGALAAHARAASLRPDSPAVLNEHANALMDARRTEAALGIYREALRREPGNGDLRFNHGLALLCAGRLREGWREYRARWDRPGMPCRPALPQPEWDGEPLPEGALLVWREQGLGDELMFGSCLADAAERVGRLVIACDPRLVALFARAFPAALVVSATDPAMMDRVRADRQIALGDLPAILRPTLDTFPSERGYLAPDPVRLAAWRRRLDALGPEPKVGLCWRSGLLTESRRASYAPLEAWYPVLRVPGLVFVNLQYDHCGTELEAAERALGVRVHRWTEVDLMNDLEEAAALTAALDVVLSAPTAAGELAGALGVPTWRITGGRDWTMLGGPARPWFPSMEVLQRDRGAPWETVFSLAAERLAERYAAVPGVIA